MFKKFYLTVTDIPVCKVELPGEIRYYSMADRMPVLINPVYILPGNAGEVSESEFLKYANPSAIEVIKEFFK